MDWTIGWREQLYKDRDIDWGSDYNRGYETALLELLEKFEREYYETASQDPHYSFYSKYVVDTIRQQLNSLTKD